MDLCCAAAVERSLGRTSLWVSIACSAFLFLFLKTPVTNHQCPEDLAPEGLEGDPCRDLFMDKQLNHGGDLTCWVRPPVEVKVAASPSSCHRLPKGGGKRKGLPEREEKVLFYCKVATKVCSLRYNSPKPRGVNHLHPISRIFCSFLFYESNPMPQALSHLLEQVIKFR